MVAFITKVIYTNITNTPNPNAMIFKIIKLLLINAYDKNTKLTAIFKNAIIACKNSLSSLITAPFAIIESGIKYKPIPKLIDVNETFNQFSETIPEAIKTVPHTGGVMVDNKANQNTNKCT